MKKLVVLLMSLFIAISMSLGWAISVSAQEKKSDEFELEEIIVTAEKREQQLQKTAMSIEVISGFEIRNTGRVSMEDLLRDIPNVSTSDTGGGGNTINIRGLGMDLPVGVGEGSVSTNFDGASQMRTESGVFGYFDVDRVEVLRGPQGTLYGRNSTGGAINIISTKPTTDEVRGYTTLEIGDYDMRRMEGAINLPINDVLAARLSLVSIEQEAYTQDDHGFRTEQNGMASRLQVGYTPNDETSVNLLTSYYKLRGTLHAFVDKINWDMGIYDINNNVFEVERTRKRTLENFKLALDIKFAAGPGIVTFLPTYETVKNYQSYLTCGGPPGGGWCDEGVTPVVALEARPYHNESTTFELRYANKSDSKVKWVGGLYYTETDEPSSPREGLWLNSGGGPGGPPVEGPQALKWYKTSAAFGQTSIPFSDTFRAVFGARYTEDKKGWDDTRLDPQVKDFKFSYFDWKVGIEKDLAESVMGYLTVATGHKPGGFNEFDGVSFKSESAISGELGVKSRLFDKRLQLNGDVFYYDFDNYQVVDAYFDYDLNQFFVTFFNAPKVRNYGAEIDLKYLLTRNTLFDLALTYLKNEYTADFFLHQDPFGPPTNLKGEPMPHSPEFSLHVGLEHQFVFANGSTLTPRATYRWTDEQYVGVFIAPYTLTPSYQVVDLRLGYTGSNRNWSLNFYCNNLLDEHYYTGINGAGGPIDDDAYVPGAPRTVGVSLNINF